MTVEQKAEEYYNKKLEGKVEVNNESRLEEQFEQTYIDGYHEYQKEHEWHYVKDGDLPKKDGFYEIAFHNIDCDATDICQWLNNEWWHYDGEIKHYINEKIYAWRDKPIPPKEIE